MHRLLGSRVGEPVCKPGWDVQQTAILQPREGPDVAQLQDADEFVQPRLVRAEERIEVAVVAPVADFRAGPLAVSADGAHFALAVGELDMLSEIVDGSFNGGDQIIKQIAAEVEEMGF